MYADRARQRRRRGQPQERLQQQQQQQPQARGYDGAVLYADDDDDDDDSDGADVDCGLYPTTDDSLAAPTNTAVDSSPTTSKNNNKQVQPPLSPSTTTPDSASDIQPSHRRHLQQASGRTGRSPAVSRQLAASQPTLTSSSSSSSEPDLLTRSRLLLWSPLQQRQQISSSQRALDTKKSAPKKKRSLVGRSISTSSIFAFYAKRYARDKLQLALRVFKTWYHQQLTYHHLSSRMEFNQQHFEHWYRSKGQPLSLRALDHYDRVVIWIAGECRSLFVRPFSLKQYSSSLIIGSQIGYFRAHLMCHLAESRFSAIGPLLSYSSCSSCCSRCSPREINWLAKRANQPSGILHIAD